MPSNKLLIVDDEPNILSSIRRALELEGYGVQVAGSGAQALERLAAQEFDLMLLDVVMPGMDGYEVCRRIRESAEAAMLPIVMVTALDQGQERVRGLEAGADDFLTNPSTNPNCWRACVPCYASSSSTTSWRARIARWRIACANRLNNSITCRGSSASSHRNWPS